MVSAPTTVKAVLLDVDCCLQIWESGSLRPGQSAQQCLKAHWLCHSRHRDICVWDCHPANPGLHPSNWDRHRSDWGVHCALPADGVRGRCGDHPTGVWGRLIPAAGASALPCVLASSGMMASPSMFMHRKRSLCLHLLSVPLTLCADKWEAPPPGRPEAPAIQDA